MHGEEDGWNHGCQRALAYWRHHTLRIALDFHLRCSSRYRLWGERIRRGLVRGCLGGHAHGDGCGTDSHNRVWLVVLDCILENWSNELDLTSGQWPDRVTDRSVVWRAPSLLVLACLLARLLLPLAAICVLGRLPLGSLLPGHLLSAPVSRCSSRFQTLVTVLTA